MKVAVIDRSALAYVVGGRIEPTANCPPEVLAVVQKLPEVLQGIKQSMDQQNDMCMQIAQQFMERQHEEGDGGPPSRRGPPRMPSFGRRRA